MRHKLILASLLLSTMIPIASEADISIGINLDIYPHLVRVPGYPVYYAPEMDSNYFFYDGQYWVYTDDNWYASNWYSGPWDRVDSEMVPLFVLRIPVRYYRQPPMYFHGWSAYSPPHWDEHWGNTWSQHHRDWNHWDRRATHVAAPLPAYQMQYTGSRYPRADQQQQLQNAYYNHQPHRAPASPVEQSQGRRDVPVSVPSVVQPPQSHDNADVPSNRRTGQRDNHLDRQHNDHSPDVQQPIIAIPHAASPAPEKQTSREHDQRHHDDQRGQQQRQREKAPD